MNNQPGLFVISLDLELMWGVRDVVTKDSYGNHILGVHTIIKKRIEMFDAFGLKTTVAAVGFLFLQKQNRNTGLFSN